MFKVPIRHFNVQIFVKEKKHNKKKKKKRRRKKKKNHEYVRYFFKFWELQESLKIKLLNN